MKIYNLRSSPFLYAPELIRWAQNEAAFEDDVPVMTEFVSEIWNIPLEVAKALVSGGTFTVENEDVIFEYEDS